jgi:hypothetical protein
MQLKAGLLAWKVGLSFTPLLLCNIADGTSLKAEVSMLPTPTTPRNYSHLRSRTLINDVEIGE